MPDRISGDARYAGYFDDCVGALDGTHVRCSLAGEVPGPWRDRKGELSQNILAVVGFNMQFQYVLAGWEGCAHDMRVLDAALSHSHSPLRSPEGKFWLGDAGYSNRRYLLVPFRATRYHLKEWAQGNLKYPSPYVLRILY